jgi:hypothetical protein
VPSRQQIKGKHAPKYDKVSIGFCSRHILKKSAKSLSQVLDYILELPSVDGKEHTALEIARLSGLKPRQVETVLKLLCSIEFNQFGGERAIVDPTIKRLILSGNNDEGNSNE